MQSLREKLKNISVAEPTEEDRRHELFLRVAAEVLEESGLCYRERVLAEDGKTTLAIRLVFSPVLWTEDLHLRE
jgi:hypothetical protein